MGFAGWTVAIDWSGKHDFNPRLSEVFVRFKLNLKCDVAIGAIKYFIQVITIVWFNVADRLYQLSAVITECKVHSPVQGVKQS